MICIFTILTIGFVLGVSFRRTIVTPAGNKPLDRIDQNQIPKDCLYGGKTYKSGEGFPSEDGCNSCSCEDGQVACTLIACE